MCTMGAQKSGRPMVAPMFIDGNAIGFVGAGNARQTIPQSASLTAPFTQGSRCGAAVTEGLLFFSGLFQLTIAHISEHV